MKYSIIALTTAFAKATSKTPLQALAQTKAQYTIDAAGALKTESIAADLKDLGSIFGLEAGVGDLWD